MHRRLPNGLNAAAAKWLRLWQETGWVVLLSSYLAAIYLDLSWIEFLLIALMLAALGAGARTSTARMTAPDWNVLAILLFEIPSLLFSIDRANSVRTTEAVIQAFAVYCIARAVLRSPQQLAIVAVVLALGGCCIALPGIREFHRNAVALAHAGFSDLVAFRSRLILPHGRWVVGEWFTLLLLLLPFAAAAPLYLWRMGRTGLALGATILAIPISVALVISLSRAVLWSTVLFVLATWGLIRLFALTSTRAAATGAGLWLLLLSLIVVCASAVDPGVLEAYLGSHPSQTRSNEGRFATWKRSARVVTAHPVWGVGSSNSALALAGTANESETTGTVRSTFSLPLQLLVEKGTAGLVLYASLPILVGYRFLRGMRTYRLAARGPAVPGVPLPKSGSQPLGPRARSDERSAAKALYCALAAGAAALLCRELVYASLFSHALILVLFALLLAVIASAPEILNEDSLLRPGEHGAASAGPMDGRSIRSGRCQA
ncbi:MAG TPA: O-antigen ligase family protein [Terracidiphilus sp.]